MAILLYHFASDLMYITALESPQRKLSGVHAYILSVKSRHTFEQINQSEVVIKEIYSLDSLCVSFCEKRRKLKKATILFT